MDVQNLDMGVTTLAILDERNGYSEAVFKSIKESFTSLLLAAREDKDILSAKADFDIVCRVEESFKRQRAEIVKSGSANRTTTTHFDS